MSLIFADVRQNTINVIQIKGKFKLISADIYSWCPRISFYRPQTKFAKVMFLQVSVCPQGGGCAWQGMCVAGCVCGRGVCVVGGACMAGGACVVGTCMAGVCLPRGVHGRGCAWWGGGHAWHACSPADTTRYGDVVNERAVRILLECILVLPIFERTGTDMSPGSVTMNTKQAPMK